MKQEAGNMIEKKILVVENEDDQREMMRQLLGRMGYVVEVAESCEAAIDIMESDEFPVVITDLIMSGMDGMELCEHIKAKNPKCRVYAFSGHADLYSFEKIKQSGFDKFLTKPVKVETLANEMKNAFDGLMAEKDREH
jgi:CheY-like chemotaxis protein